MSFKEYTYKDGDVKRVDVAKLLLHWRREPVVQRKRRDYSRLKEWIPSLVIWTIIVGGIFLITRYAF